MFKILWLCVLCSLWSTKKYYIFLYQMPRRKNKMIRMENYYLTKIFVVNEPWCKVNAYIKCYTYLMYTAWSHNMVKNMYKCCFYFEMGKTWHEWHDTFVYEATLAVGIIYCVIHFVLCSLATNDKSTSLETCFSLSFCIFWREWRKNGWVCDCVLCVCNQNAREKNLSPSPIFTTIKSEMPCSIICHSTIFHLTRERFDGCMQPEHNTNKYI